MTNTVRDMTAEGYKIQTVEGRQVLTRYFSEYDETFLCPAKGARGRWNTGTAYDNWLGTLDTRFGKRLVKAGPECVSIQGKI